MEEKYTKSNKTNAFITYSKSSLIIIIITKKNKASGVGVFFRLIFGLVFISFRILTQYLLSPSEKSITVRPFCINFDIIPLNYGLFALALLERAHRFRFPQNRLFTQLIKSERAVLKPKQTSR